MIEYLPEVVVVGDIEMLFLGAAGALGMPKVARRVLNRRYGTKTERDEGGSEPDLPCSDCPTPEKCSTDGCQKEGE